MSIANPFETDAFAPEAEAPETEILTVDEAAKLLKVGRNTLYDAIGRGEVPHRRIGRKIRLSRAGLLAWLGSCSLQGQGGAE